jgi:uncharacterized membrane protein
VVLCCQSVLLFWNLDLLPAWGDELFTLRTVGHPIATIISTARYADIHPPLYPILLHYWDLLPLPWSGIAALRAFSAIAVLLATFLFDHFWVCHWKAGRRWLTLVLFAFSPCILLYGRMARSYAMQTGIALLAISLLWRWLQEPNLTARRAVPAFTAAALLLYTDYLPGFAVLAGFSLIAWRRLGLARATLFCAAIAASCTPWLLAFAAALRNWEEAATFRAHYALTGNLIVEQGPKIAFGLISLTVGESFFPLSLALVPVMLTLAWWGSRLRVFGPVRPFLCLTAAIAYFGAARWVTWPFLAARLLWLLPFLMFALALGILRCAPPIRRIVATAILASFAFSAALYFRREDYANLGYTAPVREIAARIKLEASARDLILIDEYNTDVDAIQYYLRGYFKTFRVSAETVALVRTLIPPAPAVWIVRNTRDVSPGHLLTAVQADACHGRRRSDVFYERYSVWQRSALRWIGGATAPEYFYEVTVCT